MGKLWFLVIFAVLWLLDTVFTVIFVGHSGLEAEGNPVVRSVMEFAGMYGFVAFKLVTFVPISVLYKHISKWIYGALVVIMVPVVYAGAHMAFWPV